MANFIATINLIDADEESRTKLHTSLKKESFKENARKTRKAKTIAPLAEYERSGNISITEVIQSVLRAVKQAGKNYSFTVIKQKSL